MSADGPIGVDWARGGWVQLAERLLAWRCEMSAVTWGGDGQSAANVAGVVCLFLGYGGRLKL